jgi:hypothetical protein
MRFFFAFLASMSVMAIFRQLARRPALDVVSDTESRDNLGQFRITLADAPICAIWQEGTAKSIAITRIVLG